LHLLADYSPAVIEAATRWGWEQTRGAVLVLLLATLAVLTRRRAPVVTFGLLWAAVAIAPVTNVLIPTGIVLAERALYLPSVGFLIAGVGGASALARQLKPTWPVLIPRASIALVAIAVTVGVARSAIRQLDWHDHARIWQRTLIDAPTNFRPWVALGELLEQQGNPGGALLYLHRAVALYPTAFWVDQEIADLYHRTGRCPAAVLWYAESVRAEPDQPISWQGRIDCLQQMGREDEARAAAKEFVQMMDLEKAEASSPE
jgi:tetratricopeptide (TPR) repeat protein